MCWLPNIGLNIDEYVREGGVLVCDGVYDLVIFFLAESIQEWDESVFDRIDGHESSDDGHLMDSVDSRGEVVGLELFFKKFKRIDVLHTI